MMNVKVIKYKLISGWVDQENLTMLDEMESKTMHNHKKVINRGNRSKALSEVEPVQNSVKNLQSFLEISPVRKQNLPSHKPQNHA